MNAFEIAGKHEAAGRAAEFALIAKNLMAAKGRLSDAIAFSEQTRAPARVQRILKEAGTASAFNSPGWGSELSDYRQVANGFLESLRTIGVFDRLLAGGMVNVPLKTRLVVTSVPAEGAEVAENAAKPRN